MFDQRHVPSLHCTNRRNDDTESCFARKKKNAGRTLVLRRLCYNVDAALDEGSPVSPPRSFTPAVHAARIYPRGSVSRGRDKKRRRERKGDARWCRVIRMQTAIVIAHRNTQPVFRQRPNRVPALPLSTPTLNEQTRNEKTGQRARCQL